MAYAARQDMINRFGERDLIQLTDRRDPPAGVIDDTVLNQAIADAEAEVNAYLSGRYSMPLTSIPPVLVRLTCDIARYQLFGADLTDEVRKRYDAAVAFLKSVAKGEATLGLDAAEEETVPEDGPDYQAEDRVFNRTNLSDY